MSNCPKCAEEALRKRNQQIEKVKTEAIAYGKANSITTIHIVETKNKIIGWRVAGDESLARLKTIDIITIA